MNKKQFSFESELDLKTKEFLLDCSLRVAAAANIEGVDALHLITTVLKSGIIEVRSQLAFSIDRLKECEDVLKFYAHSWDSGDEAKEYFERKTSEANNE